MIKNAFAIPARSAIAICLQRQANSAHRPKPAHQIRIYPAADAIRRQQISKASI